MLAANEAVARYLESRGAGALFRIHEAPDPAKIDTLARFVEPLGLELPKGTAALEPLALQRLLARAEDLPQARVIHQVTLRSMKQARYSATCAPHFGLATANYCHFTSPIRRYPDLVVHRCLRALRQPSLQAAAVDANALEALALQLTERERNAEAAERELLTWKKIAFISRHVGESFDGLITGVARFGLFVQLVESLVEGLVHVEQLGDERFEHLEDRLELVGTRSGRVFRVGDTLRARVVRVDRALLRVDLVPEAATDQTGAPGRRRRVEPRSNGEGRVTSPARGGGKPRRRKV